MIQEVKTPDQTPKTGRIKTAPQGVGSTTRGLTPQIDETDWRATVNGTRTCSVDGCDRDHKGRGLCGIHYSAWKRAASPSAQLWPTRTERFWSKVDRSAGPDGCWPWIGSRVPGGYGIFHDGTRVVRAHRYAYMTETGTPASGEVDHTCHNGSGCVGGSSCAHRACVNPRHLEDVDHRTNVQRGNAGHHARTRKTECINGHPYDEHNTYIDPTGHQRCRACNRARVTNRREN